MFFFCKLSALAEKCHPVFPVISFAASLSFTNLFEANVNRQTEINVLVFFISIYSLEVRDVMPFDYLDNFVR